MLGFAFVIFVGLGPLIFLALIRPRPTVERIAIGAVSVALLTGAAWMLRRIGGDDLVPVIGGLAAMWLAWIVTIAIVVQAIVLRRGRGRPRKWGAAFGAAATVAPWFGLSLAMTVAG